MKEVKKVLSAALAATLATGVMGTVAGAAPMDDLYKAAYDATINALEKKDQDSINAAREAINKLPNELQAFKGEFSKQVDTVQHPILVTIVDAINNAEKTLKQVDINAARKSIPANLPEVWRNSYSTGVDTTQQKLIKKATDAADKAVETGKKADLDIAKALLKEISTVENNEGVKTWLATYEKDFSKKIKLTVDSVEVVSNDTIKVNFTREVDAASVVAKAFNIAQKDNKSAVSIASVKTSDDKMSVTVKFGENVVAGKEYTVDVKDLKDLNGNTMVAGNGTFAYAKADSMTVSLNKKMFSQNEDLKNSVVVTDNLGRDITKDVKITFESSDITKVDAKGIAVGLGQAVVTVVVKDNDENVLVRGEKLAVEVKNLVATEYQGYSVYTNAANLGPVYSKFDKTVNVKKDTTANIVFFFKDQYGSEMQSNEGVKSVRVLESQTTKVATASVSASNKELVINPISQGIAYFKVEITTNDNKTIEKVISVNVVGESAVSTLELDKTNLTFEKGAATTFVQKIKVNVKDQYGDVYKRENHAGAKETVRLFVKNPTTSKFANLAGSDAADVAQYATVKINNKTADTDCFARGEVSLDVNATALNKVGQNTFKVQYELEDKDGVVTTLEKEFTVNVSEKGDFAGYNVGKVTTLDIYDNKDTVDDEREGTFKVEAVSANGAVQNYTTNATITIVDKNGVDIVTDKAAVATDSTNQKFKFEYNTTTNKYKLVVNGCDTGNYTVKVKVGSTVVETYTLTVNDTTRTATTVQFNKNGLEVQTAGHATSEAAIKAADLKGLVVVRDQNGKEIALESGDHVYATEVYVSPTANVDGTYDVVIKKVNVTIAAPAAGTQADKSGKNNVVVSETLKVRFK